jgi:hypothetical protein
MTRLMAVVRRAAPVFSVALVYAVLLVFAVVEPSYAQATGGGAEQAAENFTTLMQNVARAAAAGFFFGGLVFIAIGSFAGMPKLAMMGKGGAVFGVVLFLAQRLYSFATNTASGILG